MLIPGRQAESGPDGCRGTSGGRSTRWPTRPQTMEARTYAANRGPILLRPSIGIAQRATRQRSASVKVGLEPPLHLPSRDPDAYLPLRMASRSGSLNQPADCDRTPEPVREEIEDGCKTPYNQQYARPAMRPHVENFNLPRRSADEPDRRLHPDCVQAMPDPCRRVHRAPMQRSRMSRAERLLNPCDPAGQLARLPRSRASWGDESSPQTIATAR